MAPPLSPKCRRRRPLHSRFPIRMLLCCVSITCLALSSIRQKHSRARSHASGRGRQTEPGNTAASCWATSSFTSRCLPAAPERSQEACIACPGGSLAARARARPQACFPATGQIARMRGRRGREGGGGRRRGSGRRVPASYQLARSCFSRVFPARARHHLLLRRPPRPLVDTNTMQMHAHVVM